MEHRQVNSRQTCKEFKKGKPGTTPDGFGIHFFEVQEGVVMSATTQSSAPGTTETAEPLEKAASAAALRFRDTRRRTLELSARLTPEDMMVQSCAEASPAKWHLAHTTWFFESFILREFLPGYRVFNEDFTWLFNSYYQSFSAIPEKRLRASFSRPGLEEILRYREHVDHAIELLLAHDPPPEAIRRIELGANHEEQHQELLLTDILHAFFSNPLRPAYRSDAPWIYPAASAGGKEIEWLSFSGGLSEFGHTGDGFCFDNELTRHRAWLEPYQLASRLTTCGEFAGIHCGRRLREAGALAVCRLGCRESNRLAGAALLEPQR